MAGHNTVAGGGSGCRVRVWTPRSRSMQAFLVVFGIIPAAIVGGVVLIVKLTKPKSVNRYNPPGAAPTGPAPGWYPDQNDPSLLRYFDGRIWTSATRPNS